MNKFLPFSKQLFNVTTNLLLVVICIIVLPQAASADPGVDTSCSGMEQHGFTAALNYCVRASIGNAVMTYIAALQDFLLPYLSVAAMVAIATFGFRMMTLQTKEPVKDTMTVIFRLMVGIFCFQEAPLIYIWIAGTPPSVHGTMDDGIINEAVGWVTVTVTKGAQCTYVNPVQTYPGQEIWQVFDCIIARIFGAVDPAGANSGTFAASLLVVIGAAFFSGTMGVTVAVLGLMAFLGILLLVFRAMFLVLLSYLCVGFLTVLAPLIGPLLFFESKFLTTRFKNWIGIVTSTIFQPVFVLGFMSMAVTIEDQMIDGTMKSANVSSSSKCKPPTYQDASHTVEPAKGWGQDGEGICSFADIFFNGNTGTNAQNFMSDMMEQNAVITNWVTNGDEQAKRPNRKDGSGVYYDAGYELSTAKTGLVMPVHQFLNHAGAYDISGTRLKEFVPTKQTMLLLLTFLFVTYILLELLKVIPQMAADMTISVGINLYRSMQLPFEQQIRSTLSSAESKAKSYVSQKPATKNIAPVNKNITKR